MILCSSAVYTDTTIHVYRYYTLSKYVLIIIYISIIIAAQYNLIVIIIIVIVYYDLLYCTSLGISPLLICSNNNVLCQYE